jgi:ribosomal protein S4
MQHPSYLLNPGDMFQVDPERVMYATGAAKDPSDQASSDDPEDLDELDEQDDVAEDTSARTQDATASSGEQGADNAIERKVEEEDKEDKEDPRETLKTLLAQAQDILDAPHGEKLNAKQKQGFRGFRKQVRRQLSRSQSRASESDDLESQLAELKTRFFGSQKDSTPSSNTSPKTTTASDSTSNPATDAPTETPNSSSSQTSNSSRSTLISDQLRLLRAALTRIHNNPVDPSKPYATPWMPRPYMSPFAFIPPYLEVNQKVCAAVYLRHPVARPGAAEVPTPYDLGTGETAFTWYLRRK